MDENYHLSEAVPHKQGWDRHKQVYPSIACQGVKTLLLQGYLQRKPPYNVIWWHIALHIKAILGKRDTL